MIDKADINKIKSTIEEFFQKTTIPVLNTEIKLSDVEKKEGQLENQQAEGSVAIDIKIEEPQILIGEKGQTLFEIQRLLRTILNRRLQKIFYLDLDINDYKKKKVEYLKEIAKDLADEVAMTKEEKVLSPMSAYERRVIHAELSNRSDITTESQGDSRERHIVIKPK